MADAALKALGEGLLVNAREILPHVWPLLALVSGIYGLKLLFRVHRWLRLLRAGIREIDRMDGRAFEEYLYRLFRRSGYSVERTRCTGDYGADLILSRKNVRTVVQAKRSSGTVGVKAVQEAVAARAYYDCTHAMVVTNAEFTAPALRLAEANGVELWNRARLEEAILSARGRYRPERLPEADPPPPKPGPELPEPATTAAECCAVCGELLSARDRRLCHTRAARFGSRLYCAEHQPGR